MNAEARELMGEYAVDATDGSNELFTERHIGPGAEDVAEMLKVVGVSSLEELVEKTIPKSILLERPSESINGY